MSAISTEIIFTEKQDISAVEIFIGKNKFIVTGIEEGKLEECRADVLKGIYEAYMVTSDKADTLDTLERAVRKGSKLNSPHSPNSPTSPK